jgi:DNA-binding LacI/PurR family transcriptional regulator
MAQSSLSNPDNKRIQMVDVARLAGVSVSTVSRALNGNLAINLETRNRINELARSLNYTINVGAKNLRRGENRTVGVVIPYDVNSRQNISDPFFLGMLGSLADALTAKGYDLLLSRVDAEHLNQLAELYDSGRVSGIIVIGQWGHHDQLNALAARQVPLVVWGAQLPRQMYCSVGSDNVLGARLATAHLLSTDRKRIAFLGNTALPEVALRYQGYSEAHAQAGRVLDAELLVPTAFTASQAKAAVEAMVARGLPFDAIFASSDLIAMTAINVLQSAGKQVPADISIMGYDDIEGAAHFHPPLSTVRQSIELAGPLMVEALEAVRSGQKPESYVVQTTLVLRETAPVAK